jgi:hypothetical protein
MPKWSKDATEFAVNVHYSDDKGTQVRIPKPLLEKLGNPDRIKFVIDGRDVKIIPAKNVIIGNKIKQPKVKARSVKSEHV